MIKLRSLNLESLNYFDGNQHYSFVKRLASDQAVKEYISSHFDTWVDTPENDSSYEVGKAYVITDLNDKLIGMCGSTSFNEAGVIDLWVAIDKGSRNKNYGEKILVQMTEYFLDNIQGLNNIKLVINRRNHASLRVAEKSGYTRVSSNSDSEVYNYFSK